MRIDSGVPPQSLRVRQAFGGFQSALRRQQARGERLDLRHQGRIVESQSIPLEQGEFRVVPAAVLAVPEHPAQLIDVAAARGEQAFHREFRRGVQVERSVHAGEASDEGFDLRIARPGARSGRGSRPRARRARQRTPAYGPRARRAAARPPASPSAASPHRLPGAPLTCDAQDSTPPHRRTRAQQRIPADPVGLEQQDHRRAHVEASEFGTLLEEHLGSGNMGHRAPRRRGDVAGPNGGDAADVERSDQHDGELPKVALEQVSTRSFRAKRRGTCCAVTLFTLNRRPGTYTVSISRPRSGMWMR